MAASTSIFSTYAERNDAHYNKGRELEERVKLFRDQDVPIPSDLWKEYCNFLTTPKEDATRVVSIDYENSFDGMPPSRSRQNSSDADILFEEIHSDTDEEENDKKNDKETTRSSYPTRSSAIIASKSISIDSIDEGLSYNNAEKECFAYYTKSFKTGSLLLKEIEDGIKDLEKQQSEPLQKLINAVRATHGELKQLSEDELEKKKYKMAMALVINTLDSCHNIENFIKSADLLNNYIQKSCVAKTPWFNYAVAGVLLLLAAAAITFAILFTAGTPLPLVVAAAGAGIKSAMVSGIGYGIGSILTVTGIRIGRGSCSFFKPPEPPISKGCKELLNLADTAKSYAVAQNKP